MRVLLALLVSILLSALVGWACGEAYGIQGLIVSVPSSWFIGTGVSRTFVS